MLPILTLAGASTYEVAHAVTTKVPQMLPSSKLKVRPRVAGRARDSSGRSTRPARSSTSI